MTLAPEYLPADQATALWQQWPQPLALCRAQDGRVCWVNSALIEHCGVPGSMLLGLELAQLQTQCPTLAGRVDALTLGTGHYRLWQAQPRGVQGEPAQDELTGLISRALFEQRLRARLMSRQTGALIRFEVDQLRLVNDAYGRAAGNDLLRALAALLQTLTGAPDLLARFNGDEFVIATDAADVERAWQLAERVRLQVLAQGFAWAGQRYGVTMSIGVAMFADANFEFAELLSAAWAGCEAARRRGRNRIEIFRPEDAEVDRLRGERTWGARVLDALEAGRFAMFRQRIDPIGNTRDPRPHFEALLRVRNSGGWAAPVDFVAAAERYGLMPQMDRRVITRVIGDLGRIRASERPICAINLSGATLGDPGLPAFVARSLERFDVQPTDVCFEITETAAIANTARAVELVRALKKLGCSVALDDFGVGMSSFSYLKTLDVDIIKIDGSFVRNILTDAVDAATVESIVRIAQMRGLTTVAECVETADILQRLAEYGVDYAQGYYLHRPEPWSLP